MRVDTTKAADRKEILKTGLTNHWLSSTTRGKTDKETNRKC